MVTSGEATEASGGKTVTSGGALAGGGRTASTQAHAFRLAALLALLAYAAVQTAANTTSIIADRSRLGLDVDPGRVWAAELSSLFGWLVVFPFVWLAVSHLRPPQLGWIATAAAHCIAALVASGLHILLMAAARWTAFALMGQAAPFGAGIFDDPLYEVRKDIATYVQIGIFFAVVCSGAAAIWPLPGRSVRRRRRR